MFFLGTEVFARSSIAAKLRWSNTLEGTRSVKSSVLEDVHKLTNSFAQAKARQYLGAESATTNGSKER